MMVRSRLPLLSTISLRIFGRIAHRLDVQAATVHLARPGVFHSHLAEPGGVTCAWLTLRSFVSAGRFQHLLASPERGDDVVPRIAHRLVDDAGRLRPRARHRRNASAASGGGAALSMLTFASSTPSP
jgi:hypothetical protein